MLTKNKIDDAVRMVCWWYDPSDDDDLHLNRDESLKVEDVLYRGEMGEAEILRRRKELHDAKMSAFPIRFDCETSHSVPVEETTETMRVRIIKRYDVVGYKSGEYIRETEYDMIASNVAEKVLYHALFPPIVVNSRGEYQSELARREKVYETRILNRDGSSNIMKGRKHSFMNIPITGVIFNIVLKDSGMMSYKNGDTIVYIIEEEETGIVKIGITKDIEKRMSSIQNGNSRKLRIRYATDKISNHDALEVERSLHSFYKDKRLGGEWFRDVLCSSDFDYIVNRYHFYQVQ